MRGITLRLTMKIDEEDRQLHATDRIVATGIRTVKHIGLLDTTARAGATALEETDHLIMEVNRVGK